MRKRSSFSLGESLIGQTDILDHILLFTKAYGLAFCNPKSKNIEDVYIKDVNYESALEKARYALQSIDIARKPTLKNAVRCLMKEVMTLRNLRQACKSLYVHPSLQNVNPKLNLRVLTNMNSCRNSNETLLIAEEIMIQLRIGRSINVFYNLLEIDPIKRFEPIEIGFIPQFQLEIVDNSGRIKFETPTNPCHLYTYLNCNLQREKYYISSKMIHTTHTRYQRTTNSYTCTIPFDSRMHSKNLCKVMITHPLNSEKTQCYKLTGRVRIQFKPYLCWNARNQTDLLPIWKHILSHVSLKKEYVDYVCGSLNRAFQTDMKCDQILFFDPSFAPKWSDFVINHSFQCQGRLRKSNEASYRYKLEELLRNWCHLALNTNIIYHTEAFIPRSTRQLRRIRKNVSPFRSTHI